MNVLVACEFSGIVRDAFIKRGHNAVSIDLLPSESNQEQHIQGDILDIIYNKDAWSVWDLMIAFPPCTYLAVCGNRWFNEENLKKFPGRLGKRKDAIKFFMYLVNLPVKKICVENPIGIMSTRYKKPDQIIQPWWFGHETTKATCLWLKNLSPLKPSNVVGRGERRYYPDGKKSSPLWHWNTGKGCGKERSVTFQGIADAMAEQWGDDR